MTCEAWLIGMMYSTMPAKHLLRYGFGSFSRVFLASVSEAMHLG